VIIVVEPGMSQVIFWAYNRQGKEVVARSHSEDFERLREPERLRKVLKLLAGASPIEGVAFRILFGRDLFEKPAAVNTAFIRKFMQLVEFYPLYIPAVAELLKLFVACCKGIPLTAFFETAFFAHLPDHQRYYALPAEYYQKTGVRKWGFHGITHEAAAAVAGKQKRVVSIVIDRQTTICSMSGGKPVTISLGYTPLEGVMGRNFSGDLDPGIVFYLMKRYKFSLYKIDQILKEESGFLGMTGYDLTMAEFAGLYGRDEKVDKAFSVYQNQILKYIGEGIAEMGGVDAIVFSGANLEAFSAVVYTLVKKLSFLGISLACLPWEQNSPVFPVSSEDSPVQVYLNSRPVSSFLYFSARKMLERPSKAE